MNSDRSSKMTRSCMQMPNHNLLGAYKVLPLISQPPPPLPTTTPPPTLLIGRRLKVNEKPFNAKLISIITAITCFEAL